MLMIGCTINASPVAAEISVPASSRSPKNRAINTVSCDKAGPDREAAVKLLQVVFGY